MKHPKLTKVLAFFLAVLVLIGPGAVVSSASESSSSGGTMNSLTDLLSAIKYSEYLEKYAVVGNATDTVVIEGDALLQYATDITNAYSEVYLEKGGKFVTDEAGNKIPKFVKDKASITYDGQIAIVQEKDGKTGLYLPNNGIVGWSFNVPKEGMYNIVFNFYANDASTGEESKTTSIERSLYINGNVPFYEARFLTMSKSWVDEQDSFQHWEGKILYKYIKDGKNIYRFADEDGNVYKQSIGKEGEYKDKMIFVKDGKVDTKKIEGAEKYPVYSTDINGNEVELTEDEYLAIGEDNAVVSYRKRKPNWPWERL
jgi:hypothetical protein